MRVAKEQGREAQSTLLRLPALSIIEAKPRVTQHRARHRQVHTETTTPTANSSEAESCPGMRPGPPSRYVQLLL